MPFAGFSDLELKVIALRTNGIRPGKIALELGCHYNTVLNALQRVYEKVGFSRDLCLLTRWAMENGLDEMLGPERPEERPVPGMPAPPRRRVQWPLRDARRTAASNEAR